MTEHDDRQARFDRGMALLNEVSGGIGPAVVDSLADVSPELGHQLVAWGFGEIYSRPQLAPRDRQLVTIGMLTALGGCEPQLRAHVNTSLDDVIRTRIMLTDFARWEDVARAHGERFHAVRPACTFVQVSGFIDPAWTWRVRELPTGRSDLIVHVQLDDNTCSTAAARIRTSTAVSTAGGGLPGELCSSNPDATSRSSTKSNCRPECLCSAVQEDCTCSMDRVTTACRSSTGS